MAQSYVTTSGTLIIPSAVASIQVQTANSGLATSGVLMLVGEADAGPDFTIDAAGAGGLQVNAAYGPGQGAQVAAKYGSGPIVDMFNAASQPANDPNIQGAPQSIIICKTNPSVKAQSNLLAWGGGNYAVLADKSYGTNGNLIYFDVATPGPTNMAEAEVVPTTGSFAFAVLPSGTSSYSFNVRVNGGTAQAVTVNYPNTPTTFVTTDCAGLSGCSASGGTARNSLGGSPSGTLTVTLTGTNSIEVTFSGTWTGSAQPQVGDTLYIPSGSSIVGAGSVNVGSYVVTASSTNTVNATKVVNGTGVLGASVIAPVAVSVTSVVATTDLQVFAPVTISVNAGNPVNGLGKNLAFEDSTGTLADLFWVLNGTTPTQVTWVGTTTAPTSISSSQEYVAELDTNRQLDNISEQLVAGGRVGLLIQYQGTSATLTWDGTNFTLVSVGGSGAGTITLAAAQYNTIGTLAAKITSYTGWTAAAGSGILAQLPVTALDQGTYNCGAGLAAVAGTVDGVPTTIAEYTGRVKVDAYDFYNEVTNNSVLVQLGVPPAQAAAGLPEPQVTAFLGALVSGARGGTTAATVVAALAALELCQGNFVVTLFSRSATLDIAAGLTDPSSTYQISAVNLALRTHVLKMAQLKRKRNRQGFASIKDTFVNAQMAAANIACFRVSMTFQDVKNLASDGTVEQFQPWMGAGVAAGMQAAGFYKGIVQKYANISGALQAAGDFSDQDDDQVEEALLAGLLPLRMDTSGGWYWVSDQTTYGTDNNFVYNSIQATYVADIIALTTAMRMQQAFVGQSVADVSASLAVAFIEGVMSQLLALKLIAPSSDAPQGYKNIVVQLAGTALVCSLEVKLAGLIYFVPIAFLVSQVTQTATS